MVGDGGSENPMEALKILDGELWEELWRERLSVPRGSSPEQSSETTVTLADLLRQNRPGASTLRSARNDSIVAHGMAPVPWYQAEAALRASRFFLERLVGADVRSHPLTSERMRVLAQRLTAVGTVTDR